MRRPFRWLWCGKRAALVWLFVWCANLAAPATAAPPPRDGVVGPVVVLVPGFMGFRSLGAFGDYWKGWREALTTAGYRVFEVSPQPIASSEHRAAALLQTLLRVKQRTGVDKVLIVAHSQGGVDVRLLLEGEGAKHIAAVATLSSPHHGTALADTSLRWLPAPLMAVGLLPIAHLMQAENQLPIADEDVVDAIDSLSIRTRALALTDNDLPPPVPVYSFAAVGGVDVDGACNGGVALPPTRISMRDPSTLFGRLMIAAGSGATSNDGVVPTSSMRYGTFVGCVPGDHAVWLGWYGDLDQKRFAVALAGVLAAAGAGRHADLTEVIAVMGVSPRPRTTVAAR